MHLSALCVPDNCYNKEATTKGATMWKNRVKPETHNPDSDDQLELELDDRYRQAEQFTFDFPEENEREKLARVRRLLET